MIFQSKYQKNYNREIRREFRIQNIMKDQKCDRIHAVHVYDYEKEMRFQNVMSKYIKITLSFYFFI